MHIPILLLLFLVINDLTRSTDIGSQVELGQKITGLIQRMKSLKSSSDVRRQASSASLCDAILGGTSGSFTSPNRPNLYPSSTQCLYTLTIPSVGMTVDIKFQNIDVEFSPGCLYDFIVIEDPDGGGPLQEQRICGKEESKTISVGPLKNSLLVTFQSDYSVNGEGFGATYIWHGSGSIAGSPFAESCPTSCPNFCNEGYRKELYCTSCQCRSAQGQELHKCGSENPKKACSCGYAADIQGCPACICDNPLPVVSSPYPSSCGSRLGAAAGTFTSPDFPKPYSSNANCEITINSGPGIHNVILDFVYLDIENDTKCDADSVQFAGISICGNGQRYYVVPGVSGDFVIRLRSDQNFEGLGYVVEYEVKSYLDVTPTSGVCPRLYCQYYCPHGFRTDTNGCDICSCILYPVCAVVTCLTLMFCPFGFVKDENGCDVCVCRPDPVCAAVTCRIFCQFGFVKDGNGCDVCVCQPGTSIAPMMIDRLQVILHTETQARSALMYVSQLSRDLIERMRTRIPAHRFGR